MEKYRASQQGELPSFSFGAVRNKVAMLMVMGSAALPACKASIDGGLNSPEGIRNVAAGEDGIRTIYVSEAASIIDLVRLEKDDKSRITGLLNVSVASPLRKPNLELRQFELPEEALPWNRMVVAPSLSAEEDQQVLLQMEGDQLAIQFICKDINKTKLTHCKGEEIEPEALEKLIAGWIAWKEQVLAHRKGTKKGSTEKKKDEEVLAKSEKKKDAGTEESVTTGTFFKYATSPEIAALLGQLKPAIASLDYEEQKKLARRLAGESHKEKLEGLINEIESGHGSDLTKLNMVPILEFLLASNHTMLPKIAKELGVTLPADIFKKAEEEKQKEVPAHVGVLNLTESNFEAEVLSVKNKPVLVNFWASWCGVCRLQTPIIEELAREIGDKVVIARMNFDENENLSAQYATPSLPTTTIFKNGAVKAKLRGLHQKKQLLEVLKRYSPK